MPITKVQTSTTQQLYMLALKSGVEGPLAVCKLLEGMEHLLIVIISKC